MLFDAMNDKSRIVEVYDKVVTYKFEDGQAWRVTQNGALVSVEYNTAMSEIEQYRERDGRHYKYDAVIGKKSLYGWLAALCFAGTIYLLVLVARYIGFA